MGVDLSFQAKVLRALLALVGLAMVVIGLNTAVGGMATLGWQFRADFLATVDPLAQARHDRNARFFAGVYVAFGAVMAAAAFWFRRLRPVIVVYLCAIAVGGLFRLTQSGYSPLLDFALLPSVISEIVLCPMLAVWVARSA